MRERYVITYGQSKFRYAAQAFLYMAAWRGCIHAACCLEHWLSNGSWCTPESMRTLIMESWGHCIGNPERLLTRVAFTFPSTEVSRWVSTQGTTIRLLENRLGNDGPVTTYQIEVAGHKSSVEKRINAIPDWLRAEANIENSGLQFDCPPDCPKCLASKQT